MGDWDAAPRCEARCSAGVQACGSVILRGSMLAASTRGASCGPLVISEPLTPCASGQCAEMGK